MKKMATTASILALAATMATGAGAQGSAGPATVEILGSNSYLRGFMVYRTPVRIDAQGAIAVAMEPVVKDPKPLPDYQSPLPPADWIKPDFDDSAWDRQRAPVEILPSTASHQDHARFSAAPNSMICLRGKFVVGDPSQVRDLTLALEYVGGVVVYVNGREIARGHMPPGAVAADTLAEQYPADLHCEADGTYLQDPRKNPAGFARRYRRLTGVAVPAQALKRGANVLAIQICRAPLNESAIQARRVPVGGMYQVPGIWSTAALNDIRLAAAANGAVAANVARPKGVQVWNVAPYGTVTALDYGDPGEPLPIRIAAARNSVFSGRLVVSSDAALVKLEAVVSDLKAAGGGQLPAASVRVRCAEPATPDKCWTPTQRFNGLADVIPAEIAVTRKGLNAGAVAPLWFTVRVPRAARAGLYEGKVTVSAQGLAPTAVPLHLTVHDWVLPDPKDFRQHHLIFVSQEAVARHYGVPFWSERHFELMGKSLALLAEVNARELPINLGVNFYGGNKGSGDSGNAESMVRWVKRADGTFAYDFTVFDKYCDLVARHYGKPLPLRLNCWGEANKEGTANSSVTEVTVMDEATGVLATMPQPLVGTEESRAFWKPVIDMALKRLAARGWLDATAFGHNSYCYPPSPKVVDVARGLWPEGVWAYTAHNGTLGAVFPSSEKGVGMPAKYSVGVWTEGKLTPRGYRALLQPRPSIWANTARTRHRDSSPLVVIRNLCEEMIMRGQDGVGDFGSDLFPIRSDQGNRFYCLGNGRGTGGPNDAQRAILAPGPEGAIATERFENFREGTEICEGILYLEQALMDKRVSGELERQVNSYLDERAEVFTRFWYDRGPNHIHRWSPAGQFERDARLLELCAAVAAAAK